VYKIRQFLNSLEHYELVELKKDLERGNLDFLNEIKEKINRHEKKHGKYCATCSSNIDSFNSNTYTMVFGPDDFKKKASFCGLDCLEYFMINLKQMKKESNKLKGDNNAEKIE
jgi:hypothetical protein